MAEAVMADKYPSLLPGTFLYQNQFSITSKSIQADRNSGMGWGEIAKSMGLNWGKIASASKHDDSKGQARAHHCM